ncbi:MAG: SpoIIE family protein phosphatase [Bacteroidetes bacterium]|nr:SpoIIE family protein phosphatase [Bacteroidota bacterium]
MSPARRTSRSDAELSALFEFSQVVNSSLDLTVILNTVLLTLMGKLLVTTSVVMLRTGKRTFTIVTGKGIAKGLFKQPLELPSVRTRLTRVDGRYPAPLRDAGINLLFPILSQGKVIGFFGVAEHPKRPLDAGRRTFAETLISIAATAIEKGYSFSEIKTVNRTLDEKVHQLKTLFELAKDFGGILEKDALLKLFTLTLMGQVGTSRYAMCLKEGASIYSRISGEYLESDKQMLFQLVTAPMLSSQVPVRKRYAPLREHLTREKIAALIPLQMQNEVKGVLCIGERLRGSIYSESDLEFIYSLANLAFVSLENSRLFAEAVERQKLENELLIAKEIQRGLLPRTLPQIPGFCLAAANVSSKQVGGDYYDVIPTEDGNWVVVIADVSGKGTPASLLMANVQATVHALVPFGLSLSIATARINDLIHRNTGADKFITFFWGILDPVTRTFRYVNAGHNPPFLMRADGRMERLTEGGLILGIMKTIMPYQEGSVTLGPGDSIVMFTDGVSEAMDAQGVDYTEERLEAHIASRNGADAQELLDGITQEVRRHSAGAPQSDDITMVVLKAE